MRALFVTTQTNDVDSLIRAWDCWNETPSARVTYPNMGARNDQAILATARSVRPDVIMWVGGAQGSGNPAIETFKALRDIAPTINLCCDAGDNPWHPVLRGYKATGCFDLQVGLDGCADAPVDLVTVTPVDTSAFDGQSPARDIACGFSGNFGRLGRRWAIIAPLEAAGLVTVRKRQTVGDGYPEHAHFLRSCRIIINTSYSGSGRTHHVKGRAIEAGFAGAALLEPAESPLSRWFPADTFYSYAAVEEDSSRDAWATYEAALAKETTIQKSLRGPYLARTEDAWIAWTAYIAAGAANVLKTIDPKDAANRAAAFSAIARERYHPKKIYGAMLERIGLVDHTVARPAA